MPQVYRPDVVNEARGQPEDWLDKSLREAQLIAFGLLALPEAAVDAMAKLPPPGKLAWSAGLGFLAARLTPARGLLGKAAAIHGAGQAAVGLSAARQWLRHGRLMGRVLADNWRSGRRWNRNVVVTERTFARFAGDATHIVGGILLGQGLSWMTAGRRPKHP